MLREARINISVSPTSGTMEQNHVELAVDFTLPQNDSSIPLEGYAEPTSHQILSFGRQHVDSHRPCCHSPETTINILRDCPWAREVWYQSPGIFPLSFFCMALQDWLLYNATLDRALLPHHIPWRVIFPFTC